MWTTVGSCPKCGAPIYAPSVWHGITPPPNTYSCACNPHAAGTTYTTTDTGPWIGPNADPKR